MKEKKKKHGMARALAMLLVCGITVGIAGSGVGTNVTAYAETAAVEDGAEAAENMQTEDTTTEKQTEVRAATDGTATQQMQVREFTFRDWFGLVFCCALGIGFCLWVAFYGDPKERERIRNKKIRKQLEQEALMKAAREEKKRKEAEEAAQADEE